MELRPTFVFLLVLGRSVFYALFFAVWGGMFFGALLPPLIEKIGWEPVENLPWVLGVSILILFPLVSVALTRFSYSKTRYRVLNDRLEYFEGFWTQEEKTVSLSKITEANLRKGLVQRFFNLGTIVLSTNATGSGDSRYSRSGIRFLDIENPEAAYQEIKSLIAKHSTDA